MDKPGTCYMSVSTSTSDFDITLAVVAAGAEIRYPRLTCDDGHSLLLNSYCMTAWLLPSARRWVHSPESNGGRRLIWQSRAKSNDRSLTTGDLGPQLSFAVMRITLTIGDHHDQIALSTVQCERGSALREY